MTVANKEKLERLKLALKNCGLEYVITRTEGNVAHINIWIGEGEV
tara:strand:- start:2653 stop:2787 length:135 start_codon:yes stop_codon:yes gene_type:complete